MRIAVLGKGSLAATVKTAARKRGFEVGDTGALTIVAVDVEDHDKTGLLNAVMLDALDQKAPVVVTSQVPPGWTRGWSRAEVFCQPHTLIKGHEVEMACAPEFIAVGCFGPRAPLPGAYVKYLSAFECPIYRMSYESAEMSKIVLNFMLAASIEAANKAKFACDGVGANWEDIENAIRLDRRIGKHAYVSPGVVGGHLPRDVHTLERLA